MAELHHGFDMEPFPPGGNGRELYFERIHAEVQSELETRGYMVVMLGTLPRVTALEERAYLLKKAIGIETGTVRVDKTQENMLHLLFKHTGMLDEARGGEHEKAKASIRSTLELLEEARLHKSRLRSDDTAFGQDVSKMLDDLPEEPEDG